MLPINSESTSFDDKLYVSTNPHETLSKFVKLHKDLDPFVSHQLNLVLESIKRSNEAEKHDVIPISKKSTSVKNNAAKRKKGSKWN